MPTISSVDLSPRERSLNAFPAGSNGEFNLPPDLTMVIERGEGCHLWDTEGRQYIDFSMGWGSALVGHGRPEIAAAVGEQLGRGFNFAYVTEPSLALAERIIELSPACETVRFCASGTEATMYCLRLARAFTGRHKVLRFEGAYHGAHDVGVTSLFPQGPPSFPQPDPSCDGLSPGLVDSVLVAPFNDADATREIISRHAADLGAVIVEPLQRCVPPEEGFLQSLRDVTREHDIPLIFDEVVTGFRLALGGAQEYYGVVPDLVAYGKALGGGFPIGAFGGRREIMELVCEERMGNDRYVWVASSLGGNPISTTAAQTAIDILAEPGTYDHLHSLGEYLRNAMREVLRKRNVTAQIIGDGPLAQVVFSDKPIRDYRTSRHHNADIGRSVMLELFRSGLFLNPMGTKLYLSLRHTEAECDEFCDRFGQVLASLAK